MFLFTCFYVTGTTQNTQARSDNETTVAGPHQLVHDNTQ